MQHAIEDFVRIAAEIRARIDSESSELPDMPACMWFMDVEPLARQLATAWGPVAKLRPTEHADCPFVVAQVWAGNEPTSTATLPHGYAEGLPTSLRHEGKWAPDPWMAFLILRDPDGTVFVPLAVGAYDDGKLLPSPEVQSRSSLILKRWIRHFGTPETDEVVESDYAEPIGESGAQQAQFFKKNVPTNEDVSRVVNLVADGMPVQTAAKKVAENSEHSAGSLKTMYYTWKRNANK